MAPKRKKGGRGGGRGNKKAKTADPPKASGPPDLTGKETYCNEIGIDIENGGSKAVFQWLCCSIIFGNRLSEKTTIRAAKGLINSGLTDPKSVKDASWEEKIKALNSEGNVQRGPSMSDRLGATADAVLEKYDGDISKLKDAAKSEPAQIRKLVKEFKGIGETGVDIFFREVQLQWEELFPFADKNSLKLAKQHGYPSKDGKELAEFVGNDRKKFVSLLAALTKDELRGDAEILGAVEGKENGKADEKEPGEEEEDEKSDEKEHGKADEPMKEAEENQKEEEKTDEPKADDAKCNEAKPEEEDEAEEKPTAE